jgi:hypothetical protein
MFDFKITDSGELYYDNNTSELVKAESDDKLRQQCICRIKSVTNDWFNDNRIGANLESFLGEPNNQDTATSVMTSITDSLMYNNLVKKSNVFIIPKVDRNFMSFVVFIRGIASKTPIAINVEIDIISGVRVTDDFNN